MDEYLTVAGFASADLEVKRSLFRCWIAPAHDEQQARALVERARSDFHDARHHCSAFIWEPDASMSRSSDDGEPSGTAGAPMLEVLRGSGLTNVAAVVTRWFGGTLLGAGGLVRAYSDAVRAGLDAATLLTRVRVGEHELVLDHAEAARVESELRARGTAVLGVRHAQRVTLQLGARDEQLPRLEASLAELTHGAASLRRVGERWVDQLG